MDLDTNVQHCGDCDAACPRGASCSGGVCACPEGTTECGDACVDLQTSATHCGACGVRCDTPGQCRAGACFCESAGLVACAGSCVDLDRDAEHCGGCRSSCGGTLECLDSTCGCSAPLTACGSECVDLQVDPTHCGACGRSCSSTTACRDASCIPELVATGRFRSSDASLSLLPATAVALGPEGRATIAWFDPSIGQVVVRQMANDGTLRWTRSFLGVDEMSRLAADDTGRVALALDVRRWAGVDAPGGRDGRVMVFDDRGDIAREWVLGDTSFTRTSDVAFRSDGGLVIVGGFERGTIRVDDRPFGTTGYGAVFVVSVDAAGEPRMRTFSTSSPRDVSVVVGPEDEIYVATEGGDGIDFGAGRLSFVQGVFVARLDSSLAHVWSREVTSTEALDGLALGPTGLHLGGRLVRRSRDGTVSFSDDVSLVVPERSRYPFVLVLDRALGAPVRAFGTPVWGEALPTRGGIAVDAWGDTYHAVTSGLSGEGREDGVLLVYAPNGGPRWWRAFGSDAYDQLRDVDAREDWVIVGGRVDGTADLGEGPTTPLGDLDAFFALFRVH